MRELKAVTIKIRLLRCHESTTLPFTLRQSFKGNKIETKKLHIFRFYSLLFHAKSGNAQI